MEGILHFMYVVAIKDSKAWDGDSPAEISMIAFWNLIIMWLKVRLLSVQFPSQQRLKYSTSAAPYTMAVLPSLGIVRRR